MSVRLPVQNVTGMLRACLPTRSGRWPSSEEGPEWRDSSPRDHVRKNPKIRISSFQKSSRDIRIILPDECPIEESGFCQFWEESI